MNTVIHFQKSLIGDKINMTHRNFIGLNLEQRYSKLSSSGHETKRRTLKTTNKMKISGLRTEDLSLCRLIMVK